MHATKLQSPEPAQDTNSQTNKLSQLHYYNSINFGLLTSSPNKPIMESGIAVPFSNAISNAVRAGLKASSGVPTKKETTFQKAVHEVLEDLNLDGLGKVTVVGRHDYCYNSC